MNLATNLDLKSENFDLIYMKRVLSNIAPDILNSFSGVETHGEYFYSFLKKHSILDSILTKKSTSEINSELDDVIIIKKSIEVNSNKSLTGYLKEDTKYILRRKLKFPNY